jgi:hypothetical protein
MTDKKTLYQYRIKQAEETFSDCENIYNKLISQYICQNRD